MIDIKNLDQYELLMLGVESILSAWPLLRGAVDTKFNEYEKKNIRDLNEYLSNKNINFNNLSNLELENIFIKEMVYMLNNYDLKEDDIDEYLLIFMDEIFDSIPHENDNSNILVSKELYKLKFQIINKNFPYLEELITKCKIIKDNLTFKKEKNNINQEVIEEDSLDEEDKLNKEKEENEEINKMKEEVKMKKKKNKKKIDIDFKEFNHHLNKIEDDFSSDE